jgi:hypothetical protein
MSVLCVKRKIPIRNCGKNCDVMEVDIAVLLNIKEGRESNSICGKTNEFTNL